MGAKLPDNAKFRDQTGSKIRLLSAKLGNLNFRYLWEGWRKQVMEATENCTMHCRGTNPNLSLARSQSDSLQSILHVTLRGVNTRTQANLSKCLSLEESEAII